MRVRRDALIGSTAPMGLYVVQRGAERADFSTLPLTSSYSQTHCGGASSQFFNKGYMSLSLQLSAYASTIGIIVVSRLRAKYSAFSCSANANTSG